MDPHTLEAAAGIVAYFLIFLFFLIPVLRAFLAGKVSADLDLLKSGLQDEASRTENVLARQAAPTRTFDPLAERVGAVYLGWLQSALGQRDLDDASPDEDLREALGHADVVEAVLRGETVELPNDPDGTEGWWLVVVGQESFLLPRPASEGAFMARSAVAYGDMEIVPAAVRRFVAARVETAIDGSFQIAQEGLLSESVREAAIETDADVRRLPALESDRYESPLVREAVQQVDAAYPGGDYHRFDLLRLPSHAEYTERIGMARNMAGLFVLVGLGLTMWRLNGVVGSISETAGTSNMSPEDFILRMGSLMGNIGGAFTASIWGLAAMVVALIVLSIIDRVMQVRFARVEHVVSDEVLPVLVKIQQRDMPTATLPAVLRATQKNIERLDETVQGLTTGMASSLEGMGQRITDLLQQLGTYERRSADLDRMLRDVAGTAHSLDGVVSKLDAAAAALLNPLDRMREQIADPLTAMVAAVGNVETGYASVAAELRSLHAHLEETTRRTEGLMATSAQQQQEQLKAIGGHLQGFRDGARELGPVVQKLSQVTTTQASAMRELQTAAQRLSGTGQVLHRAAEQFHRHGPAVIPPSLFAWFYNGMMSSFERMSGRRPEGWSRYDGLAPSGDGARGPEAAPAAVVPQPAIPMTLPSEVLHVGSAAQLQPDSLPSSTPEPGS